jgi:hypothetical protein
VQFGNIEIAKQRDKHKQHKQGQVQTEDQRLKIVDTPKFDEKR